MARSATGIIVVMSDAELFAEVGSLTAEVADTVLVMFPARNGWTVISRVTTVLLARLGQVAKIVPALLLAEPPALGMTETKSAPRGNGSIISKPGEVEGPRLVTNTV